MIRLLIYILLSGLFVRAAGAVESERYAGQSVLSSGKWVKMRITDTGVYKLTYDELRSLGFSDPSAVSVFGYGGASLPEDFRADYIDDLPATAIYRGDNYILFYAQGSVDWRYDDESGCFEHTNNPYSSYGYYFLSDTSGKEMEILSSVQGASLQIDVYDDYMLHERDEVSVSESGRHLYGESFISTTSRDFVFDVPGITDDEGRVSFSFIGKPTIAEGYATLSINGDEYLSVRLARQSVSDTYTHAVEGFKSGVWDAVEKPEQNTVTVSYSRAGDTNVRLNYIRLQMKRRLQLYGACTLFRSIQACNHVSRFVIDETNPDLLVFDVTDKLNPSRMELSMTGNQLGFTIPAGDLREFALVNPAQLPAPEIVGFVENQNLHGYPQTDMIIIASEQLSSAAERLAAFHREQDGLSVEVVSPETIYNEFSSGTPDATAYRRFMKMFYDRKSSDADAPKYLLLFGDAAYDNRGLTSSWASVDRSNFLLAYESEESLGRESFVTDDYFGFLDDDEGGNLSSDDLDIGIGRFPVRTYAEASAMVDKVIAYAENSDLGEWKNSVSFIADDGNNADNFTTDHADQADQLAEYLLENFPCFNVNKLYMDGYKKQQTNGNQAYPEVNTTIQKQLEEGLFLINYVGHGNTQAWADERILEINDITQATYKHLPLWITATCDFSRFDAVTTSAGEEVFLNEESGGIALFTTTRTVNSYDNFRLNQELVRQLFSVGENGSRLTLGDVMKHTKRNVSGSNKLNFILIGDPALTLSFPEYTFKVTEINGQPVTDESQIQLKALERVSVSGLVQGPDGASVPDFNGRFYVRVMDSKSEKTTLGNNTVSASGGSVVRQYTYTDYSNTLYKGTDSVRQGNFSFSFTVPKDILYLDDYGKMTFYAQDGTLREAQGAFSDFVVGSSDDSGVSDEEGPEIVSMYLNDSVSFAQGASVNSTPLLVADVYDENGINITGSSIGHDITLIIDNDPNLHYVLNDFYAKDLNRPEGWGRIVFSIPQALEDGEHTAELKVWDVLNNSSSRSIRFQVDNGASPEFVKLVAGPNPARTSVTFYLWHNRPESNMEVSIYVYDMAGRLQWYHTESGASSLFQAYTVTWNLCNNSGSRLQPGIYLYRAAIRSGQAKEVSEANKLIILGQ